MHAQAQSVAQRVRYEWWMLNESYSLYKQLGTDTSNPAAKNAFLESFLLHARNLYQFLTRRRASLKSFEESDVVAEDFFDTRSEWKPPNAITFLNANWTRLNRSLAHLTYDRVEYEKTKKWVGMDTIRNEINQSWDDFLTCLPETPRSWFS